MTFYIKIKHTFKLLKIIPIANPQRLMLRISVSSMSAQMVHTPAVVLASVVAPVYSRMASQILLSAGWSMEKINAMNVMETYWWILRASDSDSDISLRFRFGHRRQANRLCSALNTRMKTITDSLDIDCITELDTSDN